MTFNCPKLLTIDDEYAGMTSKCSACECKLTVPSFSMVEKPAPSIAISPKGGTDVFLSYCRKDVDAARIIVD